jgi:hypothetical protein
MEPCGDLVVLGDEIDDCHGHVWEGLSERGDPPAGGGGHRRRVQHVEHVEPAGVHDLLDKPADDGLVVLRHRVRPGTGPVRPRFSAHT